MHPYLIANSGLMLAVVAASVLSMLLASRILPQVSTGLFKKIILAAVTILGTPMLLGII